MASSLVLKLGLYRPRRASGHKVSRVHSQWCLNTRQFCESNSWPTAGTGHTTPYAADSALCITTKVLCGLNQNPPRPPLVSPLEKYSLLKDSFPASSVYHFMKVAVVLKVRSDNSGLHAQAQMQLWQCLRTLFDCPEHGPKMHGKSWYPLNKCHEKKKITGHLCRQPAVPGI